ncbi:hypothetical protein B566_EDAN009998 [Ephemera danica]|nr:hypothetical protein B566_EDAN009998 [Ephemera danica]
MDPEALEVQHYLTEEEKEFLAARPNYAGLLEKAQDLEEASQVIHDTTLRIVNHPDPLVPTLPHWPKTSGNS